MQVYGTVVVSAVTHTTATVEALTNRYAIVCNMGGSQQLAMLILAIKSSIDIAITLICVSVVSTIVANLHSKQTFVLTAKIEARITCWANLCKSNS